MMFFLFSLFLIVQRHADPKDLTQIKPPYSDGKSLDNPSALSDGNPDTYTTQLSPGEHSIQWNFRGQYSISLISFKLEEGVTYPKIEVKLSNFSNSNFVSVGKLTNFKQGSEKKGFFIVPAKSASHIKLIVDPGKEKQTRFNSVEIWGTGDHDESPPKYDGTRSDTEYTKLVWSDEFDGDELNLSNWRAIDNVHFTHHVFTNKSISIKKDGENSYLAINVKNYSTYENLVANVGPIDLYPGETINKTELTWAAGRLESKDLFAFQHGRVAFRAKCALTRGHWAALWMLAQDERGHDEIDVLEAPQMDADNAYKVHTTNHYGRWHLDIDADPQTGDHKATDVYEALSENFHVYETEWDMDSIRFYFDGEKVFETTKGKDKYDGMHNRPMYLIIDTHLSRNGQYGWGGATYYDLSNQDQDFLVDWVRVYQKPVHNRTFVDPLYKVTPGYQNTKFLVSPCANSGDDNFVLLSDGKEQWQDRHNFYYDNGMPFDERSRVAVKSGKKDQYLIYNIDNVHDVHFSVYYQTIPDKNNTSPDGTRTGISIRDRLLNGANIDFKMFTSETGKDGSWKEFKLTLLENLNYPYPVYTRITYDAYNLPENTNYVKIVFPNYEGVQYTYASGKVVDMVNTDIQLSKIVFVRDDTE